MHEVWHTHWHKIYELRCGGYRPYSIACINSEGAHCVLPATCSFYSLPHCAEILTWLFLKLHQTLVSFLQSAQVSRIWLPRRWKTTAVCRGGPEWNWQISSRFLWYSSLCSLCSPRPTGSPRLDSPHPIYHSALNHSPPLSYCDPSFFMPVWPSPLSPSSPPYETFNNLSENPAGHDALPLEAESAIPT